MELRLSLEPALRSPDCRLSHPFAAGASDHLRTNRSTFFPWTLLGICNWVPPPCLVTTVTTLQSPQDLSRPLKNNIISGGLTRIMRQSGIATRTRAARMRTTRHTAPAVELPCLAAAAAQTSKSVEAGSNSYITATLNPPNNLPSNQLASYTALRTPRRKLSRHWPQRGLVGRVSLVHDACATGHGDLQDRIAFWPQRWGTASRLTRSFAEWLRRSNPPFTARVIVTVPCCRTAL